MRAMSTEGGEAQGKPGYPWLRLLLGPLSAALAYFLARYAGLASPAAFTAGVTAWCALWWVTEPVPIPVTSLLPFALFPLTGVLSHGEVAKSYGHTLILLLLGGFVLSTAMEKSGAHRRVALGMVRLVGGRGRRLVLGFMLATGLTSMWISNTATTLMMIPIALKVAEEIQREGAGSKLFAPALALGVAYAASIGGVATPVGTPTNLIALEFMAREFGTARMSFPEWMAMGVPAELAWVAPLGIDLSVFGATRGLVVTAPIAARLRAGAELADTTPKRSTAGVAQDRRASVARPAESRTTATTSADTARTAGPRTVAPAVMDRSHGSTVASETDRAARAEAVTAVQGPRVADLPSPSEENRAVARRLIESGRVKQDEDQTAAVLAASDAGLGKRGIENATGVAASTAARIVAAAKELTDHPIEPSRVLAAV